MAADIKPDRLTRTCSCNNSNLPNKTVFAEMQHLFAFLQHVYRLIIVLLQSLKFKSMTADDCHEV